ncbi:MAG: lipocalin family protein [Pseudobacteriovorax sp.]|nr:lipocalin family protein [Pseudobacteriovorax sp.]
MVTKKKLVGGLLGPISLVMMIAGCSSNSYRKTVESVDLQRFMGDWYVIGGRFTFLEKGAHNAIETYSWNEEEQQIDIAFSFNKDSFDGEKKSIPQTGWVVDKQTNAYWQVSPFWPLKLDYLIIALDDKDYSWTAVGVPSQSYLWIMAKDAKLSDETFQKIVQDIAKTGYDVSNLVKVPHR